MLHIPNPEDPAVTHFPPMDDRAIIENGVFFYRIPINKFLLSRVRLTIIGD